MKAILGRCRRYCAAASLLLLGTGAAQAQVGIALEAEYTKFLRYEPVEITVLLRNYSGNTLLFGGREGSDQGYLRFTVDSHANLTVPTLDWNANPVANLILGAGETRKLKLALNELYDLRKDGSYTIKARIGHRRLQDDYESNSITIEIQEGILVISRNVGLPAKDPATPIATMTVSVLLFQDERGSIYCLRAEDKNFVYGTVRLGPRIAAADPQLDADAASDIHVFFQTRPRLFSYSVYTITNKKLELRQQRYYVPEPDLPRLSRATGYLKVVGGRPAKEGTDYRLDRPRSRME